jgi:hypothetical protein
MIRSKTFWETERTAPLMALNDGFFTDALDDAFFTRYCVAAVAPEVIARAR